MTQRHEPSTRGRRITLVEFAPSGGLFHFAVQLGEALARAGHEVELLTGPDPELASREPGLRILSVLPTWHANAGADAPDWWRRARRGVRAGQYVAAWTALLARLRRTRPDVVMWSAWRFPVDGWGVQQARRMLPNTTLGLFAHEPRPLVEQPGADGLVRSNPVLDRALAGAYRQLDVAFVLGPTVRQTLLDSWPITAPVHILSHGDEGVLAPGEPSPVSQTGPEVLFFGTITGYKGVEDLLECWPRVRAAVPDARLVLAGNVGADIDSAALARQVDELPGAELRAGYVPVDDVAGYFDSARVVALPYRRSSQSAVAYLAHTFARPVVATAVGDIPTVVRHEETGLLVPPRGTAGATTDPTDTADPSATLADAIISLLADPDLAERLGRAGREQVANGATWDDAAAAMLTGLPDRSAASGPERGELRVLQVLDSFSFGGAEHLVAELGRHSPSTWQVRAASLAPAGHGRDDFAERLAGAGLEPFHLGVRRLLDPVGFVRLVRTLRRLRPDVVHAHLGYAATLVPLAARLAGAGSIATLHHLPTDLPPGERLKERLSVRIPARLGTLVLVSRPAYDEFALRHGPATVRWQLLPNGIDTAEFAAATPAADLPRDDIPTWAVVAALRAAKGHLDLLRAWRIVVDGGRPARLLVVGEGPERSRIAEEIDALGLTGSVVMLGRRDDVPAVLAAVDGVVSASHTEALPTALIEAAAAGLPVVTTEAGGAADVVTAETGWLTPVGDPAALAAALLDALDRPDEAAARGKAARERAEREFDVTAWTASLDGLYQSSLRGNARRRRTLFSGLWVSPKTNPEQNRGPDDSPVRQASRTPGHPLSTIATRRHR